MTELTKDADKLICYIYQEYLERRKSGLSKTNAKDFESDFYRDIKALSKWNSSDISDTLQELDKSELIELHIYGDFELNDKAIVYMENRFKNGLVEITDFISKLIP